MSALTRAWHVPYERGVFTPLWSKASPRLWWEKILMSSWWHRWTILQQATLWKPRVFPAGDIVDKSSNVSAQVRCIELKLKISWIGHPLKSMVLARCNLIITVVDVIAKFLVFSHAGEQTRLNRSCASSICQNGGVCSLDVEAQTHYCQCTVNYQGKFCETRKQLNSFYWQLFLYISMSH